MNKHWKYLKYVLRHKWFVMIECFKRGLFWRGMMHDMSKLRPSEFFPYANFFYNKPNVRKKGYYKPTDTGDKAMDRAWLKHMHRNNHHWQYWVQPDGTCLEIPYKVIIEMVCDWIGAGKAQHSKLNCFGWYMEHRDKMKFAPKTQRTIEVWLTMYVQQLKKQEKNNEIV